MKSNSMRFYFMVLMASLVLAGGGCSKVDRDLKPITTLNSGRDFTLWDERGKIFRLSQYRGQVVLLFFGYLSCPDVCPITLSKVARVYTLLGDQQKKVTTLFVSVDPKRDTPAKVREYLDYFGVKSIGLTGSQKQIDVVVKAYGAYYEKVETPSAMGYLINHTDYIYLINPKGEVVHLLHPEDKAEYMAALIKRLL